MPGPSHSPETREPYTVETEDISDSEISAYLDKYEGTQKYADAIASKHSSHDFDDDAGENLFKRPRTEEEMENLAKKRISDSTGTKIQWALQAYERW